MFTFDRKARPSAAHSPAPKPASQRPVQAPPVNPLWFRLATSTNTGAAASPEMTEERRRYFEPIFPPSSAPGSRIGRAASEAGVEAEASPPVAPGPQFNFARIPLLPPPVQRKATVSSPGDPYEREADEVADKVMRMAEPTPIGSATATIQRQCAKCEGEGEETKTIQTKRAPSAYSEASLDAGAAMGAAARSGAPLPQATRDFFEPRFGHDFSRVRVHADDEATQAARAVQARAYTIGQDIVFGHREYAPDTAKGRRLLAHELTHVVQKRLAPSASVARIQRQPSEGGPPDCGADFKREFLGKINRETPEAHRGVPRMYYASIPENKENPGKPVEPLMMGTELDVGQRGGYGGLWRAVCFKTSTMPVQILWVLNEYISNLDEQRKREKEKREKDQEKKDVPKADPASAEADANVILEHIRAEAKKRAQSTKSVSKESMLYRRLTTHYLDDYLGDPSPKKGGKAIEKMGETFGDKPRDSWEELALKQWNKQKLPPGIDALRPGLPKEISAATQILSMEDWQSLKYLDVPQLIGQPNTGRGKDEDVTRGGKNISQLMHWATGVKYSHVDKQQERELFLAYEMWHMEGWDVFGEDPINDLISEEAGRILGTDLSAAAITESNLQERLNAGLGEARAWVGSLLKTRQSELDSWILAKKQAPTNHWWKEEVEVWSNETIYERLLAGHTVEDVKSWSFTQRIIDIYALVYEAEEWEKTHGKIPTSPLVEGLLAGKFDELLKKLATGEKVTSDDVGKAEKVANGQDKGS